MPIRLTRREFTLAAAAAAPLSAADRLIDARAKRKPPEEWKTYPTRTVDGLAGFEPRSIPTGHYGGRLDRKMQPAGFFRTTKRDGRWWLADPEGFLYLNVGVCSVGRGRSANNQAALKEKYGSPERWAEETSRLLRQYGFNASGGWSDVDLLRRTRTRLVYCTMWSFMGMFGRGKKLVFQQPGHLGYPQDAIPVFHPEFEPFCDDYAKALAEATKDPWLLGHFSDNELPAPADLLDRHLKLDPADPNLGHGYRAAKAWLAARKGSAAAGITVDDREAFRAHVFDRYYEITTRAIRRHDPNHLCLGARMHGPFLKSAAIFRAAGKHLDVVSVNVYGMWGVAPDLASMWGAESGKPFLVTEFYAKGNDAGFPNTSGAGWIVPTQRDRAAFYQHFTLGLIESRACAGWHWFKYMDNDPEDLTTDPSNRDSNKGIVTIRYEPYRALLDNMKPLNSGVYALADYFDRT